MIVLLIILATLLGLLMWLAQIYNHLVALKGQYANSFAQIEVQLRRRYDLIPNLVATIKGYAQHEEETLKAVTEARAKVGVPQTVFATMLGVSVRTLQEWEQGRREPSGAARSLLRIAQTHPQALRELIA